MIGEYIVLSSNASKWLNMSEESNTHSGSPSGSSSSTLDDASPSPSRQSTCERNSIRKVSFPEEETDLVTGYLEPPNPWRYAQNATREELISQYKSSCHRHGSEPLPRVLQLLKEVELGAESRESYEEGMPDLCSRGRSEILNLKGVPISHLNCEPLEEILKRLQFQTINLEGALLDDEASVALFDMVEYYEAAKQLDISSNDKIGPRGSQACSQMLKKARCLEKLVARNTQQSEHLMPALCRGLRIGMNLQILHLEHCNLRGRLLLSLVNALKTNRSLKELYLADNDLTVADASHLGGLLRVNTTLQLLDISNNNLKDAGVQHICEGIVFQAQSETADQYFGNLIKGLSEVSSVDNASHHSVTGSGLSVLFLWNNHLTNSCAFQLAQLIARSKSLDTLNVGHNLLTSESLIVMKEALQKTRTLERLGLQSNKISCEGAIALAECIADNRNLKRIDLRDNQLQIGGLMALALSMKFNSGVVRLDLDSNPKKVLSGGAESLKQYHTLVKEIGDYCERNVKEVELRKKEATKLPSVEETDCKEEGVNPPSENVSPVHNAASSSRKISLTCETLQRSDAVNIIGSDANNQRLCEPRRGLGVGRLRSPAPSPGQSPSPSPTPSPTPSPHSSPVPSPSRSRFQVSRVPELPSVISSEVSFFPLPPASSPIPSPSALSSTPTSGGSSRFKVTLVSEPKTKPAASTFMPPENTSLEQKPPLVITSTTSNVTIGFKFPAEKDTEERSAAKEAVGADSSAEKGVSDTSESVIEDDDGWNFDEPETGKDLEVKPDSKDQLVSEVKSHGIDAPETKMCVVATNKEGKIDSPLESESPSFMRSCPNIVVSSPVVHSSPQAPSPRESSTKPPSSVVGRVRKISGVIPPHNVEPEPPPRIQSSLEKLLGLFQHPGNFFSKSSNSGSQNQSFGSQSFFFGSSSGLNRPSKPPSSETQQLRSTGSSSTSKAPPPSFGSLIFSNMIQEIFPGSQSFQDRSIFSLNPQCAGKSSCPDNKFCPNASDNSSSMLPKSEDDCVNSDSSSNVRPKGSLSEEGFSECAVSLSRPYNVALPVYVSSFDKPNCTASLSESIPSLNSSSIEGDGVSADISEVDCERTLFRPEDSQEVCLDGHKSHSLAEEHERESSFGKTGLSTEKCITDNVSVISESSEVVPEISTAALAVLSCDFSEPNADICCDEIKNVQAVKDVEVEENKSWCKANEVILDREDLGQNLQLDILATCFADEEEKRLKGDELGCATVGMSCNTSEAIADLGSATSQNILSHLGSHKGCTEELRESG
ncbi:hypothetical protein J437_LFUL015401 [Ladona fulva]|uniref:Uncharacterized protein n=1 Tax=Ladona fulva TaxID=123851 RepID=A0A8K0KPK4_LADFU|nr:hypothetical protein J437_LFUL015401 [Ladona fulva]